MKHLSDAPFYGRLLALPTNIRLSWKGLPGTNTPAYYEDSKVTDVKSLITLSPGWFTVNKSKLPLVPDYDWYGAYGNKLHEVTII